ncbi:MAG: hypothetical protein RB296_10265 [Acidobacteriota bacterium]|jgi:hypothetical protein|nr:hypothetical protein [Acidobacteriota bacterium]
MNSERGKSTFFNLILVLLVIYGAFALVKHLGAGFQQRSIAAEVKDRLSLERGPGFTADKGVRAIREILEKEGVILDETQEGEGLVDVQINQERQMIEYLIRYELEVNFLFFTQRRVFEIEDEIQSYS